VAASISRRAWCYQRLGDSGCCELAKHTQKQQRLSGMQRMLGSPAAVVVVDRADQDWDSPLRPSEGYTATRSICGGLRAFLRFQVLGTLVPESLIIPTPATPPTAVWTRLTWRHGNATLCVQVMHRSADASTTPCGATVSLRARTSFGSKRAGQQWRLRIKPRLISMLCP
jgi:hypothetical protein